MAAPLLTGVLAAEVAIGGAEVTWPRQRSLRKELQLWLGASRGEQEQVCFVVKLSLFGGWC